MISITNKNLPCIKRKCLKYPVCKHKEEIICDLLDTYIKENRYASINELISNNIQENIEFYSEWWKQYIEPYFLNIIRVFSKNSITSHVQIHTHHSKIWIKDKEQQPKIIYYKHEKEIDNTI